MIKSKFVRKQMTLLEVLIATCLTMVLLTTLMFFYREIDWINIQMEKVQKERFQQAYIEKRLATVLPRTISPTDPKKDFYFYTSSGTNGVIKEGTPSLVFTYNNQIDLEKEHSGHVLGRLFLDKEGCLCLAHWPSPKRWEPGKIPSLKKEVLMENVNNIKFEFYVPPLKDRNNIVSSKNDMEIESKIHHEWIQKYNQLPAIVRIIVERKVGDKLEELTFAFPLPNTKMQIMFGD